jgi:hypothetical protein
MTRSHFEEAGMMWSKAHDLRRFLEGECCCSPAAARAIAAQFVTGETDLGIDEFTALLRECKSTREQFEVMKARLQI